MYHDTSLYVDLSVSDLFVFLQEASSQKRAEVLSQVRTGGFQSSRGSTEAPLELGCAYILFILSTA